MNDIPESQKSRTTMTLSNLVELHLQQFIQERTKTYSEPPREATVKAHRNPLLQVAAAFDREHNDVSDLTMTFLKDYVLTYEQSGAGISAVNQYLTAITEFMRYLRDRKVIDRDDLESWSAFHRKNYRKWRRPGANRKFLRCNELEDLFTCMANDTRNPVQANRDIAFFGSLLLGPSRLGELLRLNIADVKYIPAQDKIPAHFLLDMKAEYTKDHDAKQLMIFEGVTVGSIKIFQHFLGYHNWLTEKRGTTGSPDDPYFVAIRKQHLGDRPSARNWHKVFATHAKRVGLAVTPHWLRHTFGEIVAPKIDRRDLRQIYGHSDERTTHGYTDHSNSERLISARYNASLAISDF